jgi:hypothetical protein
MAQGTPLKLTYINGYADLIPKNPASTITNLTTTTASIGSLTLTGSVVAGYIPVALDYYETLQVITTMTGGIGGVAGASSTIKLARVGSIITMTCTGATGGVSTAALGTIAAGTIPARFQPVHDKIIVSAGRKNTAFCQIMITVGSNGSIIAAAPNPGPFADAAVQNLFATSPFQVWAAGESNTMNSFFETFIAKFP